MIEREQEFVVVVDTAPSAEADEAFQRWLDSKGLRRSELPSEDILIDTICARDGVSRRRYRVRRRVISN